MATTPTALGIERIDPNTDQHRLAYATINQHADKVTALVLEDRGRLTEVEAGIVAADTSRVSRAFGAGRMTVGGNRVDVGAIRYSAFPNQVLLPDGRVLMVWMEATNHIAARDGKIVGSYSEDYGRTWGPKQTFVEIAGQDLRDPTVSTSADGSILYLTYIRCSAAVPRDGFFVMRSMDNGATFGSAIRIDPAGSNGAGTAPLMELANGTLLAVWFASAAGESFDSCWRAYSPDDGVTWSAPEKFRDGVVDAKHYNEPYAAVWGDQVVIMYRHGNTEAIGITRSANSGATWSAPAQAWVGTGRPSCMFTTLGTLLVVYRDYPGANGAQHAVARWSTDLGVNWTAPHIVERADPNWMVYSCPREVAPGVVMVSTAIEHSSSSADISVRYMIEGGAVSPYGDTVSPAAAVVAGHQNRAAIVDTFDRPDSASLGRSDNGQLWSAAANVTISDSSLSYSGTAGSFPVVARVLDPNMVVEADVSWATTAGVALIVRYQDASNYWMASLESGGINYRLYKVVGGVTTQVGATASVLAPSPLYHRLKLSVVGDNFRMYFEDALVLTATDSALNTAEWAGVRVGAGAANATHKVRNFIARRRSGRLS